MLRVCPRDGAEFRRDVFAALAKRRFEHGVLRSWQTYMPAFIAGLNVTNLDPFVWTADPDGIIAGSIAGAVYWIRSTRISQFLRHPGNHVRPVARLGLAEEPHRRVPG
jgi:hypothetical protein